MIGKSDIKELIEAVPARDTSSRSLPLAGMTVGDGKIKLRLGKFYPRVSIIYVCSHWLDYSRIPKLGGKHLQYHFKIPQVGINFVN
jgi:hypothetical protein